MLAAGQGGFEGGMNARKYMALTKVSKATATRDLQALAEMGVLCPVGLGRAARYELVLPTRTAVAGPIL
jgi:Fic family protein